MAVTQPKHQHSARVDGRPERGVRQRGGRIQRAVRKLGAPVLVFLMLAGYFVWLGTEMGGATPDGQTEMAAVFGAILLAVLALVGGAWAGRFFR